MKAATTKRYYVTKEEIQEKLELDGDVESIHLITPYEHDQEVDLKDVDFIITTVIDIEELGEKPKSKIKPGINPWRLDRAK